MANVQFTGATLFESTAVFTLRIGNENPESLILEGSSHKIYINGICVGQGLHNGTLEVPRLGFALQNTEVHLSNLALATRIKPIIESGVFDYQIKSTLYAKKPSGRIRVASEGRLDLKDFQPATKPESRPQ